MKIRWTLCAVLIGLLGTAGPGCDILKKATQGAKEGEEEEQAESEEAEEDEKEEESEEEDEEETAEKEEEEEDEKEDEKDEEAEEAEEESETEVAVVEKKDYVSASVELACVDMKLGENEKIDLDKVEEEILGEYGFDKKSFDAAGDKFDGKDEIDSKIEEKLENCDEEQAKRYAGIIKGESERSDDEEDKPEPKPKPKSVGSFQAQISNQAGFDNATLQIAVKENFKVRGTFRGKREGKGFRIPFQGRVSKSNEVTANGSDSGNRVTVKGDVGPSGVSLELSGRIWDKKYRTTIEAK